MTSRDFSLAFTVDQTPEQVYAAVANVRGWWAQGLKGASTRAGDEFTYRHKNLHRSTHRVTEAEPGKRIVWQTLDADLSFAEHPTEWVGTEVRFQIERIGTQTELRFSHVGLVPELECFDACSRGWSFYIGVSLRELITTGTGQPDPKETANERAA